MAGCLENPISMNTQSSVWTWTLTLDFDSEFVSSIFQSNSCNMNNHETRAVPWRWLQGYGPPIGQDFKGNRATNGPSSHTLSIRGPPQSKILEPPMSSEQFLKVLNCFNFFKREELLMISRCFYLLIIKKFPLTNNP